MDRDEKSPRTADEQEYPEQERLVTPQEEAGMDLQELENPPQAEGPRDVWIGVWSENHGAQRFYARHGFEKVGEYGFTVGRTVDHEFILRRSADSFSNQASQSAESRHNFA